MMTCDQALQILKNRLNLDSEKQEAPDHMSKCTCEICKKVFKFHTLGDDDGI